MKRNRFKRALHHLNKKHVVESAPTNNTTGVFNVTPSGVGPVGWTDRTFTTDISGNPIPHLRLLILQLVKIQRTQLKHKTLVDYLKMMV